MIFLVIFGILYPVFITILRHDNSKSSEWWLVDTSAADDIDSIAPEPEPTVAGLTAVFSTVSPPTTNQRSVFDETTNQVCGWWQELALETSENMVVENSNN